MLLAQKPFDCGRKPELIREAYAELSQRERTKVEL